MLITENSYKYELLSKEDSPSSCPYQVKIDFYNSYYLL